jgi:hypothetical protein
MDSSWRILAPSRVSTKSGEFHSAAGRFKRASAIEQEKILTGNSALIAVPVSVVQAVAFIGRIDPLVKLGLRANNACPFPVRVLVDTFSLWVGTTSYSLDRLASTEAHRIVPINSYSVSESVPLEFPIGAEALKHVVGFSQSSLVASGQFSIVIERDGKIIATSPEMRAPLVLHIDRAKA